MTDANIRDDLLVTKHNLAEARKELDAKEQQLIEMRRELQMCMAESFCISEKAGTVNEDRIAELEQENRALLHQRSDLLRQLDILEEERSQSHAILSRAEESISNLANPVLPGDSDLHKRVALLELKLEHAREREASLLARIENMDLSAEVGTSRVGALVEHAEHDELASTVGSARAVQATGLSTGSRSLHTSAYPGVLHDHLVDAHRRLEMYRQDVERERDYMRVHGLDSDNKTLMEEYEEQVLEIAAAKKEISELRNLEQELKRVSKIRDELQIIAQSQTDSIEALQRQLAHISSNQESGLSSHVMATLKAQLKKKDTALEVAKNKIAALKVGKKEVEHKLRLTKTRLLQAEEDIGALEAQCTQLCDVQHRLKALKQIQEAVKLKSHLQLPQPMYESEDEEFSDLDIDLHPSFAIDLPQLSKLSPQEQVAITSHVQSILDLVRLYKKTCHRYKQQCLRLKQEFIARGELSKAKSLSGGKEHQCAVLYQHERPFMGRRQHELVKR